MALALCGCASSISIKTPVSEADYQAFAKPGNLALSGQLPRYSGVQVHLDPATPYTDALYRAFASHRKFATLNEDETANVNPVMLEHRRTVVADNDGAFTFDRLTPGQYYLSWYDTWMEHSVAVANKDPIPVGIGVSEEFNFDAPRGKWHFKEVTVRPGENLQDVDFN